MKLVIDIPEERFKSLKAFNSVYPHMLAPNEVAIAEGKPVAEISAEIRAKAKQSYGGYADGLYSALDIVKSVGKR